MKKVCEVIADFAITFNFLSGFTKQRNTEVASKTSSKVIPRLHFLRLCNIQFLQLYLRKYKPNSSQVKSCLRCKYSPEKHISIDKAWNKQHRLGERRLKQALNQAHPTFNDCQVSRLQVKDKTWYQFETKNQSALSLTSTLKNILKIRYCIYHT